MLFASKSIPQLEPGLKEGLDLLPKRWYAGSSVHDGNSTRIKELPIPRLASRWRKERRSRMDPLRKPSDKPKRPPGRPVEFPIPGPVPDASGNVIRGLLGALPSGRHFASSTPGSQNLLEVTPSKNGLALRQAAVRREPLVSRYGLPRGFAVAQRAPIRVWALLLPRARSGLIVAVAWVSPEFADGTSL